MRPERVGRAKRIEGQWHGLGHGKAVARANVGVSARKKSSIEIASSSVATPSMVAFAWPAGTVGRRLLSEQR